MPTPAVKWGWVFFIGNPFFSSSIKEISYRTLARCSAAHRHAQVFLKPVRPDQPVLHEEARSSIKRALRQYAREQSARDVALYGASIRMGWNELQARAGLSPHDLSRRLSRVREHLKAAVSPEGSPSNEESPSGSHSQRPTSPPQQ